MINDKLIVPTCAITVKQDDDSNEVWIRLTFPDVYTAIAYRDKLTHHVTRQDHISFLNSGKDRENTSLRR